MEITTELIKELRDITGVSVMQCKKALEEAGGDVEAAKIILRKHSSAAALKKSDRMLGAGVAAAYTHAGGSVVGAVILASETDFVSKNEEFGKLIGVMFGGGKAKLVAKNMKQRGGKTEEAGEEGETEIEVRKTSEDFEEETQEEERNVLGVDIEISLPKKKVKGLDVLSGGERSLVSIAVLFALISVSPPPFLVLDEIDAALDEKNAKRFGDALADFAKETQFVIVTHNRATMEAAQALYGVTMSADGTSKLVSLKLSS